MVDSPLRAAVIGCGLIGSEFSGDDSVGIYTHAGAYVACPGTQLVALCDADPVKLERSGARWRIDARYTNVDELLDTVRPEIVSLCTPDRTHGPLLRRILASPSVRAVLAEKPLAETATDARELIVLAEAAGIRLAVNYSRRYAQGIMALAQRLANGEFGRIQSVTGYYTKGVRHNGTHWLDLLRMCFGAVAGLRAWRTQAAGFGNDPTLSLQLRMAGNGYPFDAVLHGLDSASFSLFEMDIVGTLGRARLIESGHRLELSAVGDSPRYPGYTELIAQAGTGCDMRDTVLHAVADLVASVKESRPPACSGQDGLAALELAEAAIESVNRDGRWQSLPH